MKRLAILLSAMLVLGLMFGIVGGRALDAQQQPIKRTPLLQTEAVDLEGKEVIVFVAEIAPGASSGKHLHAASHEIGYLLQGAAVFEMEGKPPMEWKAGTPMYIPPKQVHEAKNASATEPLKILGVMVHVKGQPLVTPITDPHFWKK